MSYVIKKGAAVEHVDGTRVIVTESGDAVVLNQTAGFILDELLKGRDIIEIANSVVAEFEVDEDTAIEHTNLFVRDLLEKKLLEVM